MGVLFAFAHDDITKGEAITFLMDNLDGLSLGAFGALNSPVGRIFAGLRVFLGDFRAQLIVDVNISANKEGCILEHSEDLDVVDD